MSTERREKQQPPLSPEREATIKSLVSRILGAGWRITGGEPAIIVTEDGQVCKIGKYIVITPFDQIPPDAVAEIMDAGADLVRFAHGLDVFADLSKPGQLPPSDN